MKYNGYTVDYRDSYGNDLRGGMDEPDGKGFFHGHSRSFRRMVRSTPKAGDTFVSRKDGKLWERYVTKSGKLSARPVK